MAMKIEMKKIRIRDLVKGFEGEGEEEGIRGYGKHLEIRPPYQREFVYKPQQQVAVIESVRKGFPLNIMYWADREDGDYEVLDGQQRTLSICRFVTGKFSIVDDDGNEKYFDNLDETYREQICDYQLTVYVCNGTRQEKLDWFKIVNIGNVKLTDQELRNAVYHGPWLMDAKKYFSRMQGPADTLGGKYMDGPANRQKYLETAIKWQCGDGSIEGFMAQRQHEPEATCLWKHFQLIIDWVERTFINPRSFMKQVDWGELYSKYKNKKINPDELEKEIAKLTANHEIVAKKSIYKYVLTGKEQDLDLRTFTRAQKQAAYEKQEGICAHCQEKFTFEEMEGDHIKPWKEGGRTEPDNLQMLCRPCNKSKGAG